ncbi:MAG TPA: rRNA maturation RNase YbeY [Candidatus Latescibacteria bacterium]|nr:rRNA maturation RNase YbeY [Candidatus Latescibacterota bacterium]
MRVVIENLKGKSDLDLNGLQKISQHVLHEKGYRKDVNIILADNDIIQDLNRRFRHVDSPTDVLSFDLSHPFPNHDSIGGEIYISLEKAAEQAREYGVTFEEEIIRLAIHGLLHLVGYDDETESEREVMERETERYVSDFLQRELGKSRVGQGRNKGDYIRE